MKEEFRIEDGEHIRNRILELIDLHFESDAQFERRLGLKDKTVNNWRRGKSSSYMKILPELSEIFGINVGELLDMPLLKNSSELSEDEIKILSEYRRTRMLPKKSRDALTATLQSVINLYISSFETGVTKKSQSKKTSKSGQKGGGV